MFSIIPQPTSNACFSNDRHLRRQETQQTVLTMVHGDEIPVNLIVIAAVLIVKYGMRPISIYAQRLLTPLLKTHLCI